MGKAPGRPPLLVFFRERRFVKAALILREKLCPRPGRTAHPPLPISNLGASRLLLSEKSSNKSLPFRPDTPFLLEFFFPPWPIRGPCHSDQWRQSGQLCVLFPLLNVGRGLSERVLKLNYFSSGYFPALVVNQKSLLFYHFLRWSVVYRLRKSPGQCGQSS